ncbi:hypothetical protein [Acinetobacter sp.]|uniref:hypothetical protein n=1 Tax=Acinetobacter sp. TaxID=472 RepID=UPI003D00D90D
MLRRRVDIKKQSEMLQDNLVNEDEAVELSQEEVDSIGISQEDVYDPDLYDPDRLAPYEIYEPLDYRDGPEGFIKWCEDNVHIPVYPTGSDIAQWVGIGSLSSEINPRSGKSYDYIWQMQKEEIRKCLRMVNGRFVYRLIIFSWMRGEGKSLLACLIQLWKFFSWPKQQIVLGANSKDQIKFVHFDIMKDIIKNSPNLFNIIGERNIQEKEIRLRDDSGNISSVLRPISSFSGIVSNITGYTFSEIFDMKNPKFFTQLDGSIRNIPNALGVIDSTVSAKTHVLYKMYQAFVQRTTKTLFFSYRCSKNAVIEDYWNPNMDQQQLDDYKAKFPLGDFEKYFMNVWGSNAQQVFGPDMIEATNYLGVDGKIVPYTNLLELIQRKVKIKETIEECMQRRIPSTFDDERREIATIDKRLWPVEEVYKLRDMHGQVRVAEMDELDKLGELYDTNWAILAGIDRADPLKSTRTAARTIVTVVAKGLPGSKSNPLAVDNGNPKYVYIPLNIAHIADSLLDKIKSEILMAHEMYEGLDAICGERWGIWDMASWCEDQNINFEPIHPSYDKQKAAFSELHGAVSTGRFKIPPLVVWGSKSEDLFKEEAGIFFHDEDKRWFGSPEKMEKYGVQDDLMFSLAWCIYGGRNLKSDDFKERRGNSYFGTFVRNSSLLMKH